MLTTMLRRQDSLEQSPRIGSDFVHVSSLPGLCARQYFIADSYPQIASSKRTTGGHQIMWAIGKAIEQRVVSAIIADCQRQGVVGAWACRCEKRKVQGLYSPTMCSSCGTDANRYRQLTFVDENAGVIGNPDLMLMVERKLLIIEVKSMKKEDWDTLTEPLPDHCFQAHSYRKLATENGFGVHSNVAFLYVTKDFKYGDPYKEFHVPVDSVTEGMIKLSWDDATALRSARLQKAIPPRLAVCVSPKSSRAKSCPVCIDCFARNV